MTFPPELQAFNPKTLERIRKAVIQLQRQGNTRLTNRSVKDQASCDQNAVVATMRAYRNGLLDITVPWVSETSPVGNLADQIRDARTNEQLGDLAREVAAKVATGDLSASQGKTIESLIREARQQLKAHEDKGGQEDMKNVLLAGEEAYELVFCYEGIVSDDRRAAVLQSVRDALALDKVENPNKGPR